MQMRRERRSRDNLDPLMMKKACSDIDGEALEWAHRHAWLPRSAQSVDG
jgi:cobalamin biosynthesis protein CobT